MLLQSVYICYIMFYNYCVIATLVVRSKTGV